MRPEAAAREIDEITGEKIEGIETGLEPVEDSPSEKDDLEEKLKKAIDEENYELAAILRDKLQELSGESTGHQADGI